MNKKGQYQPNESYMSVHPVLIIGVALFIIPQILMVFSDINTGLTSAIQGIAVVIILIGGALSIFKASN